MGTSEAAGTGLFLERALVRLGRGSRRQGRRWILDGHVSVNGVPVRDPQALVNPHRDDITVADDAPDVAAAPGERVYLALHKPPGFITTRVDVRGRPTVYDLLPAQNQRLFPVGRLDLESEGLLLFTNDGAWANRVIDPQHAVDKQYRVWLDRPPSGADLQRLRDGVLLDGAATRPAEITACQDGAYDIVLREGRNRQVRRMFAAVGACVVRLVRVRIGAVWLDGLGPATTRPLAAAEVLALGGLSRREDRPDERSSV